ncbi:YrhB domain-containing protein [Actinoplanes sp. NPDC049316]|uniref:YrhB domain-containing protein n=1 Tax=Actinoplanes sp. NPDC049316 TaxID=3154727 RepID=UPI00341A6CB9
MVTLEEARAIAEAFIDVEMRARFPHEIVIVEYAIEDRGDAWVFPYNGRGYVERDDFNEIMLDNYPVVVDKATGTVGYAA